jgi:serine/threonine-protein kinase
VVRRLGAGAAGEVFEAVHVTRGTRRAIKILALQNLGKTEVVERMKIEARTLATLKHKNLVEVVDVGVTDDGRVWFAMELLEGTNLRKTITTNKTLRLDVAIDLAIELLAGLGAAHAAGIVHRDVKPENVFVCSSGVVKVLDFGTAKVAHARHGMTQSGFAVGTLQYMAPEQIEGKGVDPRTDLYAVGLVLYEMITGRPPFEDRDNVSLAFAHATRPPPTLADKLGHPVPEALEQVVAKALAKTKDDRFASAEEMARALATCRAAVSARPSVGKGYTLRMQTVPVAEHPTEPVPLVVRKKSKKPLAIVAASLALAACVISLAAWKWLAVRATAGSTPAPATASASAPPTASASAPPTASASAPATASASAPATATASASAPATATASASAPATATASASAPAPPPAPSTATATAPTSAPRTASSSRSAPAPAASSARPSATPKPSGSGLNLPGSGL